MTMKPNQSKDYCIESIYVGKKSYNLTKNVLDKLFMKSKKLGKKPKLVLCLGEENDTYVLDCYITKG